MKIKLTSTLLFLTLIAFGQTTEKKRDNNLSEVILFKDSLEINIKNASQFKSFDSSDPASLVSYFYASRIRKDNKWKDVLKPEDQWDETMKKKLEKYSEWQFNKFMLVKKQLESANTMYITIYMEIEVKGKKDGGTDQVTLKKQGDKWIIVRVPT